MFHSLRIGRTVQFGVCAVALVVGATLTKAEARSKGKTDGRGSCAASYKTAQEQEQSGHLVEASRLLSKCADEACGSSMSQECTTRSSQLALALPSVVVLVTDSAGEPLVDVQVKMDGEILTSHLDGLSVPVDPGPHEFTFSAGGKAFAPQKITVSKGEHNRQVSVVESGNPSAPLSSSEK